MRIATILQAIVLVTLTVTTASARTWSILPDSSGDAPTIQAGLNAAGSGDTVLVAAGTYPEKVRWPSRNGIVLIGAGMDSTTLLGDGTETTLYVPATPPTGALPASSASLKWAPQAMGHPDILAVPIDTTTVIRGIRVRHGGDAAVVLYTASPLIDSCAIDSSTGPGLVCAFGSAAQIRNSLIAHNAGGGVNIVDCSAELVLGDNMICGNSTWWGGGVYCDGSAATIVRNTITHNTAFGRGGGVYCSGSSATITRNLIIENTADYGGGGVSCSVSPATITRNTIVGNSATMAGGLHVGFNYSWLPPTIVGNSIVRNSATTNGGGVSCEDSEAATFSHNTLTENVATGLGDAFYTTNARPTVDSCNFAHNGGGFWNASVTTSPTIQKNWWGDDSGPSCSTHPEGLGDSLSLYAWDFEPFLKSADLTAPPLPPFGVSATAEGDASLRVSWPAVPLGDLAGYRVYFDSTEAHYAFRDSLDVGNLTTCLVPGLVNGTTYHVAVRCYDSDGNQSWFSASVAAAPRHNADVKESSRVATSLALHGARPNPVRGGSMSVAFTLPASGQARLDLVDVSGRRVAGREVGSLGAGPHTIDLASGRTLAPGVYMLRLTRGTEHRVSRVIVLE